MGMCDLLDEGFSPPGDKLRFAVELDIGATRMSTTPRIV